ncbi:hypothetical protein BZG35_08025 [Brevundimonas sp. LM2]|uniref:hypothetical protein n=1 Tax=Brevundimonas sp. LM2 TaxID=1938605 RepID=UPI000983BB70|nr:hypothetical protein [Brevundimonas sp. LM2]AQR61604.1 hypothetical protein BZG35_08025 [Brevundimonas sp. LM2]
MQALIDLLAGFIALLVAAALAQFGADMERPPQPRPEVHRISDCPPPPETASAQARQEDC